MAQLILIFTIKYYMFQHIKGTIRLEQNILTYCGRVMQICVFTLQMCKTDDANLRF